VVTNQYGEKLSKQNGASALDCDKPLEALNAAARHLGLNLDGDASVKACTTLDDFYTAATAAWSKRMCSAI
jgi:glutamyl-Q tRNA(Asp) synthetase